MKLARLIRFFLQIRRSVRSEGRYLQPLQILYFAMIEFGVLRPYSTRVLQG